MRFRLTSPKAPKLSENDVERGVLDYLRLRGYYPIRLHVGRFRTKDDRWITIGDPGIPDYIAAHEIYPAVFVETKAPGKVLRATQGSKVWELRTGYRLAVTVADGVEALASFLDQHEARHRGSK